MGWEQTASGYAAVWAQENTRESIFDAMKRKETYATTGPRMVVRFFGGFDFEAADANNRMPAKIGYTKGVPMGGDLQRRTRRQSRRPSSSPRSRTRSARTSTAIRSSKAGSTRKAKRMRKSMTWRGAATANPARTAKFPSVGNTVDVPNATWTQHHRRTRIDRRLERPGLRSLASAPSTTVASSKSRRRAGPPTTRNTSASRCPRKSR